MSQSSQPGTSSWNPPAATGQLRGHQAPRIRRLGRHCPVTSRASSSWLLKSCPSGQDPRGPRSAARPVACSSPHRRKRTRWRTRPRTWVPGQGLQLKFDLGGRPQVVVVQEGHPRSTSGPRSRRCERSARAKRSVTSLAHGQGARLRGPAALQPSRLTTRCRPPGTRPREWGLSEHGTGRLHYQVPDGCTSG